MFVAIQYTALNNQYGKIVAVGNLFDPFFFVVNMMIKYAASERISFDDILET